MVTLGVRAHGALIPKFLIKDILPPVISIVYMSNLRLITFVFYVLFVLFVLFLSSIAIFGFYIHKNEIPLIRSISYFQKLRCCSDNAPNHGANFRVQGCVYAFNKSITFFFFTIFVTVTD